jgi:hypothetical protein
MGYIHDVRENGRSMASNGFPTLPFEAGVRVPSEYVHQGAAEFAGTCSAGKFLISEVGRFVVDKDELVIFLVLGIPEPNRKLVGGDPVVLNGGGDGVHQAPRPPGFAESMNDLAANEIGQ